MFKSLPGRVCDRKIAARHPVKVCGIVLFRESDGHFLFSGDAFLQKFVVKWPDDRLSERKIF